MQKLRELVITANPNQSLVIKAQLSADDPANQLLTDTELHAATLLCEEYCNTVFRQELLELFVYIPNRTRYKPITYFRLPVISIESVEHSCDGTSYQMLTDTGSLDADGNLHAPVDGWHVAENNNII